MKKKIAIVRGKFLNRYEMQFFEPLIKDLPAQEGFDITAFGSRTSYHDQFAFPVQKLPSPMDLPDFPYKMAVLNRLFIDAHYLYGLEEKLRGFDLVHTAETYYHYTQQCLNAKKKGYVKKVIATVLENIPHNNEGIWGRKSFKARSRQELDHIIALTNKTKEVLLEEGTDPNKITVIGHFVDTKRFRPVRKNTGKNLTILFVGRLESYKGIFDFIEVAKMLRRDFSLTFRVVGDGSEIKKIPDWIQVMHVTYDEMPQIFNDADIFVAPSKPTETWDEQYCTALLEAQAAGLPIVTTKTGGIVENIGDAGLLVKPGDVPALAKAVQRFILDSHLRKKFASRARARAESVHDISFGSAKIAKVYNQILAYD